MTLDTLIAELQKLKRDHRWNDVVIVDADYETLGDIKEIAVMEDIENDGEFPAIIMSR